MIWLIWVVFADTDGIYSRPERGFKRESLVGSPWVSKSRKSTTERPNNARHPKSLSTLYTAEMWSAFLKAPFSADKVTMGVSWLKLETLRKPNRFKVWRVPWIVTWMARRAIATKAGYNRDSVSGSLCVKVRVYSATHYMKTIPESFICFLIVQDDLQSTHVYGGDAEWSLLQVEVSPMYTSFLYTTWNRVRTNLLTIGYWSVPDSIWCRC